jgi:hypothetical protein
VRPKDSDLLKVLEFDSEVEAEAAMLRYIAEGTVNGAVPSFYRVVFNDRPGQSNDIILRKIRLRPGSEVVETRVVGGVFEDDV